MSDMITWADTPAGLLANGGWRPEDRAVEFAAKEAEWRQARAEFDAKVAADPEWAASRRLQQALAERGWTGTVVNVGPTVPPELRPLHTMQLASQARHATWGPDGRGGMRPTNSFAVEVEQAERERYEIARLRLDAMNRRLPPGSPR